MTLELKRHTLNFSFPDVHEDAKVGISFQRTLRIPDNNKEYPLPPGLGTFPVKLVDDHKDRVPAKWVERGGVMFPMFQSEAMWINFHAEHNHSRSSAYPFAIKIATGKVSAITGETWAVGLKPKDYVVIPEQPWLDGYVVEKGIVRQFVAAPLGAGFTAEEQISGKSEHGGIQIEVIPMKKEVYERRFPKRSSILRGTMTIDYMSLDYERSEVYECAVACADMGLAPGGRMKQQVHDDPFDFDDWDVTNRQRVFVHIANSLVWKAITKYDPPHPAPTAESYTSAGLLEDKVKLLKNVKALEQKKMDKRKEPIYTLRWTLQAP